MPSIKILFAGDFCPINRVKHMIMEGRSEDVYGDVLPELFDKDLSVVNLECPLTNIDSPIRKSGPNLKAHPKAVECIKTGRFDIVSLANNHIADYGSSAVNETINLLQLNQIKYVGAGSSLSLAQKPLRVKCKGKIISFLAFAENEFNLADEKNAGAWPLDPLSNISQIRKERDHGNIVIVLVHGGNEYNPIPSPRIVTTYRSFVDAGASAVIGTHPHVPQGYEIYGGAPIFYSLGNFIFDHQQKYKEYPLWSKSYMVRLDFEENGVLDIKIIPYKAYVETACLSLVKNKELAEFEVYIDFISKILKDKNEIERFWHAWCAMIGPNYLRSLSLFLPLTLVFTGIPWKNSIIPKLTLAVRNMMTCEAHNEVLRTFMDLVGKRKFAEARECTPLIKMLQKGEILFEHGVKL